MILFPLWLRLEKSVSSAQGGATSGISFASGHWRSHVRGADGGLESVSGFSERRIYTSYSHQAPGSKPVSFLIKLALIPLPVEEKA